ncbi:hypothetical protein HAZT_HAZT011368 [Hyalella azteca]|uniref:Vitellogenin domain-containing protein n=1 Tax=Hyalella azteca TaxID=294128 RepID=A0A6A0H576_HYAAZ|nr:hypothetical protein HAZT_HAZT011368 [Hyalella azteca]
MSYEYTYTTRTDIGTDSLSVGDQARVQVTAKAVISVLAPCEFSLMLEDVELEGSQSSEFTTELTKKPLRFAFDDGLISTICSDEGEPAWVTNFKRGVLIGFQNNVDSFSTQEKFQFVKEVGLFGECDTRYEFDRSTTDHTVIKRVSEKCPNIAVSSVTTLPAAIQRVPLVSSYFECSQTILAGIINKVECSHTMELSPVSQGAGGATAFVTSTINLIKVTPNGPITEFPLVKSSLKFDGNVEEETLEGKIRLVESILEELDQSTMPVVQSTVPALFSRLVEHLREMNQRQLSIIYEANRGTRVWRFLVDAAPMVATPASMFIVRDLILSGQMTEVETKAWFTSLAFIPSPKVEMFRPLPALMLQSFSKEAFLGVSAMVNTYCKIDASCSETNEVKEILSVFELQLGSACRSTSFEEKEKILVTLKALGNAGHWMSSDIVVNCFNEEENPTEVRVAALEAWRKAPCTYDRSGLMGVYENGREDSEIRIAAYLSLMACPTKELINTIKDRLSSESVNQVGSFVWTHLTNLQESASHEKQWIRKLVGEEMLANKFNSSSLKLSRNFESSFYMDESGYGATVDSNVIFSSSSFLPRSAMLNFTLDLFGESINMFEIGGRIEGFEIFAEKFFGPNGYYPEETVEAILKNLRQSQNKEETIWEQGVSDSTSEPEGSYYLRVLGNDVKYQHFRGIENFFEKKPDFDLLQMLLDFAKNGQVDYTKSYKLMETELTYATISGLPITLKLNSTATLGLRMDGNFAMTSFRDINIDGHIFPSAAVQVDATIMVDAHVSKSGLRITSNLHSSATFDGRVNIKRGEIVDISLKMPQEKIELFSAHAEKVYIRNDEVVIVEDSLQNGITKRCTPTSSLLGLQLCSEASIQDWSFDGKIFLEKTDSHSEYLFRYMNAQNSVSFIIDTPGSRIDRKFSFVASREDDQVRIDLYSPWKALTATGKIAGGDSGQVYELNVDAGNNHRYQVTVGYSSKRQESTTKYEPIFVVKAQSEVLNEFRGFFETDAENHVIKTDLQNSGLFEFVFSFDSSLTNEASNFNFNLISMPLTTKVSGNINREDGFYSQLDAKYAVLGRFNIVQWNLDANYRDTSVWGQSLHHALGAKFSFGDVAGDLNAVVSADAQRALFDGRMTIPGASPYFAKLEATKTSLSINTNDLTLEAKIVSEGERKSVSVAGAWNGRDMLISGALSTTSASGNFKFGSIEKSFLGELEENGFKLTVHLDAIRVITGKINYFAGKDIKFTASLETPFEQYEKNALVFTLRRQTKNEFYSSMSLTAMSKEVVAFESSGQIASNNQKSKVEFEASLDCDETIFGTKRLLFQMNHSRTGFNVDSFIRGTVDEKELLSGSLKTSFEMDVRTIQANLVTPFTKDISIDVNHVVTRTNKIEIKYGDLNAVFQYEINYQPDENKAQFTLYSKPFIGESLTLAAGIRSEHSTNNIDVEVKYGTSVIKMLVTTELTLKPNNSNFVGNLRIILPDRSPITGSLATPDTRGTIETRFAVRPNSIDANFKFSLDDIEREASINGFYDIQQWKCKLRGAWASSDSEVFKFGVDHELIGNNYVTSWSKITTINITGEKTVSGVRGGVQVASDYLSYPLGIEGELTTGPEQTDIKVTLETDRSYEGKLSFSRFTPRNGMAILELDIPCVNLNELKLQLDYAFNPDISNAHIASVVNNKKIDIKGKLTKNNLEISSSIFSVINDLSVTWNFERHAGFIYVTHLFAYFERIRSEISADYNLRGRESKQLNFKMNLPDFYINLSAQAQENSATINGEFRIVYDHAFTLFYDDSEYLLRFMRDHSVTEIKGKYNFQPQIGDFSLALSSPFSDFTYGYLRFEYNLGNTKTIQISANLENRSMNCKIEATALDWATSEVTISGESHLEQYKKIGAKIRFDFSSDKKELHTEIYRNDEKVSFSLVSNNGQAGQWKLLTNLSTPFEGLTELEIGLELHVEEEHFKASLYRILNSQRQEYAIELVTDDNEIKGKVESTATAWKIITFAGKVEKNGPKISGEWEMNVDEDEIEFTGNLVMSRETPRFDINIETPFEHLEKLDIVGAFTTAETGKSLEIEVSTATQTYGCKAEIQQEYGKVNAKINLTLPTNDFQDIITFSFAGNYNWSANTKTAQISILNFGDREPISALLQLNRENILLNMKTPFDNYKEITFTGDLNFDSDHQARTFGEFRIGKNTYRVSGDINMREQYFKLKLETPSQGFGVINILGEATINGYELTYLYDGIERKISLDYTLAPEAKSFTLKTPFPGYNSVVLKYNLASANTPTEGSIVLAVNDKESKLTWMAVYEDLQGDMKVALNLGCVGVNIELNANYDFTENSRIFNIEGIYNERVEKLSFFFDYNRRSASIWLIVPFVHEEFGLKSAFDVNETNNAMSAFIEAKLFATAYKFGAKAGMTDKLIEAEIVTPFAGYERLAAKGEIDIAQKYINGEVTMGECESKLEMRYSLTHPLLEIKTPFSILRKFILSADYWNTREIIGLSFNSGYNNYTYKIGAKYNKEDPEKMIHVELQNADSYVELDAGAHFGPSKGFMKVGLKTPFDGFNDLVFCVKWDASREDKMLEISMEDEGQTKMISLSGKLVNDEMDLRVRSLINGFENFQTRGALNRSKRSLEFTMMNDRASGGIHASFNSLTVKIASDYPALNDASLTIEKPDAGGFALHYKRSSDVHFDFTATPSSRSRQYDITLDAVIPAWDILFFIGEIHKDELLPYLSGAKVQPRSTIRGGGTYSPTESDLKFDITTPNEKFESITALLKLNLRRKELKLEITSNSEFHVLINSRRSLTVDIFVPNPAEPTIIKADLSLMKGSLSVSSRFPNWRTFNYQYEAILGQNSIKANMSLERNGVQVLKLEFEREAGKAHLQIDARRGENHSVIHFHRQGFEMLSFSFTRNGHEFKIEAQGTGNLPTKGTLDVVVNNSFRALPRTVTAHIDVDRTGSPKKVKIEATFPGNRLYVLDSNYNIDLRRPQVGDYDLRITTPLKRAYWWSHLAGSWDFTDHENAVINFEAARVKYTARGKMYFREGDIQITSDRRNDTPVIVAWRIYKTYTPEQRTRDYYLKVGTQERFVMAKLKGKFSGLAEGETEYGFQASRFMANPLTGSVKWKRDSSGLSGDGSFEVGQYSGTYTLKRLKITAETKSAVLSFEAHTNIPEFTHVTVEEEYNFDQKAFIKVNIRWDTNHISVNLDVSDITNVHTEQTASLHLPSIGDVNITFGHDFRDKKNRKFTIIGQLMGRESHLKAEWNRNKEFTKLSGNVDIQTISLGHITIVGQYDVRDFHKAKAEVKYTRNDDKRVSIKWTRNVSETELKAEIQFESHFRLLPRAKILVEANFQDGVHYNFLAQGPTKEIKLNFNIEAGSITSELTTPFPGFERITGSLVYNLQDRNRKTVTLRYLRGDVALNMDINLEIASQRAGNLKVTLETPFTFVRTLSLDASWKDRKGEVHYKRNDIAYSFTGQAEVKTDGTSFEILFTPTSNEPVKIGFDFNPGSIISGQGTQPADIAHIELEILGKRVAFDLDGYRNSEHLMLHLKSESNLEFVQIFEVTLDSELNLQKRNGLFEIKVNDFHFKMQNFFERRGATGFYLRSQIDSTLTDLPGIIIGIGKDGEERTITLGIGEDRELTVAYIPKDNFRRGISGRISAPRRGVQDAAFDLEYSFSGANILNIKYQVELEPGKKTQASIEYNSDGVRARFGDYSLRMKRSITDEGFSAEVGFNDYNLSIQRDVVNTGNRKKFVIEGYVFGTKVSVETSVYKQGYEYFEGKFLVTTSLPGYNNFGGTLNVSNVDSKLKARSEIYLPLRSNLKVLIDLEGNVNMDKIVGAIDYAGQLYSIELELPRRPRSEVEVYLKIKTPIVSLSEVKLTGKFNVVSVVNVSGSVRVDYPSGSYNIVYGHNFAGGNIFTEIKFETAASYEKIHLRFDFQKEVAATKLSSMIVFFENEANLDWTFIGTQMNAQANIQSAHLDSPVSITFTGNVPQSMTITANYQKITHVLGYSFQLERANMDAQLNIMVDSPITSGRKMISLRHIIPQNYLRENFMAEITLISETTQNAYVNVNRQNGLRITLGLDSSIDTAQMDIFFERPPTKTFVAGINLRSVRYREHKIEASLEKPSPHYSSVVNTPGTFCKFDFLLSTPWLEHDVSYQMLAEFVDQINMIVQTVKIGEAVEILKFGYKYGENSAFLLIDVETASLNFGKVSFTADIDMNDIVAAMFEMQFKEERHIFDIKLDQNEKYMAAILNTPLIPGMIAKVEASMNGNSFGQKETEVALRYNEKTYAAKLNVAAKDLGSVEAKLETLTPIHGYEKLNAGLKYQSKDGFDLIFYVNDPLGHYTNRFAFKSKLTSDGHNTSLEIQTPLQGLGKIVGELKTPLDKTGAEVTVIVGETKFGFGYENTSDDFGRKLAGRVLIDDLDYAGSYRIRTKAPYEVDIQTQQRHLGKTNRFHIMSDPSMASFLSLYAL